MNPPATGGVGDGISRCPQMGGYRGRRAERTEGIRARRTKAFIFVERLSAKSDAALIGNRRVRLRVLLDEMFVDNGGEVAPDTYCVPWVEFKLAFIMRRQLSCKDRAIDEVLASTDHLVGDFGLLGTVSVRFT